jgi:hypothetical protein
MNTVNNTNYKKKKVNFQGVPNNISSKNKLLYLQNKLLLASNKSTSSNKSSSSSNKSSSSSTKSPNNKILPLTNLTSSSSASSPRAFKNITIRSPPMKPKKSKV